MDTDATGLRLSQFAFNNNLGPYAIATSELCGDRKLCVYAIFVRSDAWSSGLLAGLYASVRTGLPCPLSCQILDAASSRVDVLLRDFCIASRVEQMVIILLRHSLRRVGISTCLNRTEPLAINRQMRPRSILRSSTRIAVSVRLLAGKQLVLQNVRFRVRGSNFPIGVMDKQSDRQNDWSAFVMHNSSDVTSTS